MGAAVSEVDLRFCLSISNKLPREMTKAMAEEERRKAARYMKRKKTDG
jgi:hypothetical protein